MSTLLLNMKLGGVVACVLLSREIVSPRFLSKQESVSVKELSVGSCSAVNWYSYNKYFEKYSILVLGTSNYQTKSSETYKHSQSSLITTEFSSAHQFKNHIELFSTFFDESREGKLQNLKWKKAIPTEYKFICLVISILVFSSEAHYGLIIYVSPRMNAIAPCDQFKPIRI